MVTRIDLEEIVRAHLRQDERLLWCGSTVCGASLFERGVSLVYPLMFGVPLTLTAGICSYMLRFYETSSVILSLGVAVLNAMVVAGLTAFIVWSFARGGNYAVTDKRVIMVSDHGALKDEYVFKAGRIARYDVSLRDVGFVTLHGGIISKSGRYNVVFTIRGVDAPKEVYGMVYQGISNADTKMINRGRIHDYEDRS